MSHPLPSHLLMLLEIMDEPMLLVRSDGRVLAANAAMGRQLHVAWQALSGTHLADLLETPWDTARVYLRRSCGSRQSTIGMLTFRRPSGGVYTCRSYGNLVQPAGGGAMAIACLRCRDRVETLAPFVRLNQRLGDLTEELARRQQAEQRLQDLNRDLEERVQQEIEARQHAQGRLAQSQRMEALGQLAAGIAHDFNNVLQAVTGGLTLIQRRPDTPELVAKFARIALDAADRGTAITGRLLAFARQGELRAEPLDASELLTVLREMLDPVVGSAVKVGIIFAAGTLRLQADKSQLETVLVNLVLNARDAMPDGGTVTIAAEPGLVNELDGGIPPGHYVLISVADTGVGMDAATLARASEPFFTTKPVGKGTGLGLAMARGFAEQSGGGFAIESKVGRGTKVTLWLPQAQPAVGASEAAGPGVTASVAAPAVRVLLVDDDTLVRNVLAGGLEDYGYDVIPMPDALAALAWLEKGEPVDLLITDFSMPGMNGLALIKEIRRSRNTLPVLLLTGYVDAAIQGTLEDAASPSMSLLRKPILGEELAERAAILLAVAGGVPSFEPVCTPHPEPSFIGSASSD